MTQLELSLKIGYNSPAFLSLIENERSKIPLNALGLFAGVLDIPENEILDILLKEFVSEAKSVFEEEKLKFKNPRFNPKNKSKEPAVDMNKKIFSANDVNKMVKAAKKENARRIRELLNENEELKKRLKL